jgi:hypothetical protein
MLLEFEGADSIPALQLTCVIDGVTCDLEVASDEEDRDDRRGHSTRYQDSKAYRRRPPRSIESPAGRDVGRLTRRWTSGEEVVPLDQGDDASTFFVVLPYLLLDTPRFK